MKEYYCYGKKGICDQDACDCDGCCHWDGSGCIEVDIHRKPIRAWLSLWKLRLKFYFKNVIARIRKRKD